MKPIILLFCFLLSLNGLHAQTKDISDNTKRHKGWLENHNVPINQLPKAKPKEIIYTCDSTLLLKRTNGDTLIIWTIASVRSLGLELSGEEAVENLILKNENFGKTSYAGGIDFQGNIQYITLSPHTFLIKNDSLLELETFYTVSEDSISALYDILFDTEDKKKLIEIRQKIKNSSYTEFKLIFHPNAFKNNLYKGNKNNDTIEITSIWKWKSKQYYRISIRNRSWGYNTHYSFLFDEDYKFIEYDGCNQEELNALTNKNKIK